MDARLTVNVDRAPDYFALARLQGEDPVVFVAEQKGRIIGICGTAFRKVRLRGRETAIAYIGGIKIDREYRKGLAAFRLMKAVADYLTESPVRLGVIMIMGHNRAMDAILSGRGGIPPFAKIFRFKLAFLLPSSWYRSAGSYDVRFARETDSVELRELFETYYADYELSPVWSSGKFRELFSQHNFHLSDGQVALQNGRIAAALFPWDQRAIKNTVIQAYGGIFRLLYLAQKPFHLLPVPGEPLLEDCVRFLLYRSGHQVAARELLRRQLRIGKGTYRFVRIGYQPGGDLEEVIKGFPAIRVPLDYYAVFRPDDQEREALLQHLRQAKIWEDLSLH